MLGIAVTSNADGVTVDKADAIAAVDVTRVAVGTLKGQFWHLHD